MGVYKKGNVYWFIKQHKGRRYEESLGTDNRRLGEELYAKALTAILKGEYDKPEMQDYTFGELAERYGRWMQGRHKSADSKAYRIKMMIARFGGTRLSGITANTVEQFQTDEMARVSSAGTNKNVSLLKAMLRKGMDWGMVSRELEHSLKRISHLRESNRMRYLSKEECQTLINACEPYLKPIVITALNTGMRKSEILNLKWERVDLRHGFILLGNDTKNGERREIPLNDSMRATLQRLTRRLDIPYVFCNPATGKPYTKDLKRSFHTAMRRAGIKDFRFHDLRHTFASHLVMAGVDITTVSRLLGHKSLTMTLRYSHLAPSHLTEAVRKIENYYDFTTVAGVKEKVNAAGKV